MQAHAQSGCTACRLPITFELDHLATDVLGLERCRRTAQPGPYHDGSWAGVAIRSAGGSQSASPGFPSLEQYRYTREADQAPYIKQVLDALDFPLQVVRVLWLPPGAAIGCHYDFDISFAFGLARLHIPLQTNPGVEFVIGGSRVDMRVGEFWYGDFSQPHSVINRSDSERIHAVVDTELSDAVLAMLPAEMVANHRRMAAVSQPRPEWAQVDDLDSFACEFHIPRDVLPLLVMGRLADFARGRRTRIQRDYRGLLMLLDGEPHCRLVRIGPAEFSFMGLPPGCTIHFTRAGGSVTGVTLEIRGVQRDLVAARLGVVRGPPIIEQRVELTLLDRV